MFRRRISGAAPDDIRLPERQRDVKVDEADCIVRPPHQICRLDVAVDKASGRRAVNRLMEITERLQKLFSPLKYLRLGEFLSPF